MKIVHCVLDDKFLDTPIKQFGEIEGITNQWYCLSMSIRHPKKELRWIKSKEVQIVSRRYFEKRCTQPGFCDIIILHSLYALPFYIIPKIAPSIKVIWFAWGFDIYSNRWPAKPLIKIDKYKPLTAEFLKNQKKTVRDYLQLLKTAIDPRISYLLFKKSVNRIDYFSGVFPIEYDLLRKIDFFRAEKIEFNYGHIDPKMWSEETIDSDIIYNKGVNIQMGNSGFEAGCHLDSLNSLKNLPLSDRKIILPLSYGGSPEYTETVCQTATRLYGERIILLKEFLPFDEYRDILQSCGIVIINLQQQSAVGNILINLWDGARVFLPKTSITYHYLKNIGLLLFSVEDDLRIENINNPMTRQEVIHNRKIISERYSYNSIMSKIEKLIKQINTMS